MTDCDLIGHDWLIDRDQRGEGLICARCHVTEAELENWPEEDSE